MPESEQLIATLSDYALAQIQGVENAVQLIQGHLRATGQTISESASARLQEMHAQLHETKDRLDDAQPVQIPVEERVGGDIFREIRLRAARVVADTVYGPSLNFGGAFMDSLGPSSVGIKKLMEEVYETHAGIPYELTMNRNIDIRTTAAIAAVFLIPFSLVVAYLLAKFTIALLRLAVTTFVALINWVRWQCSGRRTDLGPSVEQLAGTSLSDMPAMIRALNHAKLTEPLVQEIEMDQNEIRYDHKGPYIPSEINGKAVALRLTTSTLVAMRAVNAVQSVPESETPGKEAALMFSPAPQLAATPKWQVTFWIGHKPCGNGVRAAPDAVLLTQHEVDLLRENKGNIFMSCGDLKTPITKIETIGRFGESSDLAALRFEPGFFSALSVKVAKFGHFVPGQAWIYTRNDLGESVMSPGSVQRSEDFPGILEHTCWTKPGASGAAVVQDGLVVAIHTGTNATKSKNLASSTSLLSLQMKMSQKESFFADGDREGYDKRRAMELSDKYQHDHPSHSREWEAADNIWTEIEEREYGEAIRTNDEIEEEMKILNMGEEDQQVIRNALSRQSGKFKSGHKRLKRTLGSGAKEAFEVTPKADIKGLGSSTSEPTSLNTAKSTKKEQVSNSSEQPEASKASRVEERVQSSSPLESLEKMVAQLVANELMKQSTRASSSPSRSAEPLASSSPSPSSQGSLFRPNDAASILSRKASRKQSKPTQ